MEIKFSPSLSNQEIGSDTPADEAARNPAPRGRPFVKGQSGNPAGRPSRARKAAVVAEALIDRETVRLTNKLIEMALAGDRAAMRLCVERVFPRRREAPLALALPPLEGTTGDIAAVMAAVTEAAANGAITAAQGNAFARMVTSFLTAIDARDFERRLSELEAAYGKRS